MDANLATLPSSVAKQLIKILAELLHFDESEIDVHERLLELGADSLILVEIIKRVEVEFQLKLSVRQLFEDLLTIADIAGYIERNIAPTQEIHAKITTPTHFQSNSMLIRVQEIVASLLHLTPEEVDIHQPLLEMGADSLILVELIKKVDSEFNIKISIRQLFEEFLTVASLADYFEKQNPQQQAQLEPTPAITMPQSDAVAQLLGTANVPDLSNSQQLKNVQELLIQIQQQIQQQLGKENTATSITATATVPKFDQTATDATHWQITSDHAQRPLTSKQELYLNEFRKNYLAKTRTSQSLTHQYNRVLCNSRRSFAMLREQTLPLFYTIHAQRSQGAKFYDVDGNEYIDIAMGFGVHFFGHNPPFLVQALSNQLNSGLHLGPENSQAGETAELLQQLTGVERFTFCNTGTEAIMTAIRMARAATKRKKIVVFKNAYHGHFDSTLVMPDVSSPEHAALPMALGTPHSLVADTVVLDFDQERSIKYIEDHGHELAAVLVEPVQNRRPDLHPKQFLKKLREVTEKNQIILIFDEILVGFRIHQGGAQAWADVKADLVTYAKIIGGGLPVAVVGGKQSIMRYVDGGIMTSSQLQQTETTYTAGTYIKNPLAVTAAAAILKQMKQLGPQLQQDLNRRTDMMVAALNSLFKQKNVPLNIMNFGSFFRFSQSGNLSFIYRPLELDLFVYHMINNGVYIWEGGTCFLSTAHTESDVDFIIRAANKSLTSMLEGGFFN